MNALIQPIRTALLQRGCTNEAIKDALEIVPVDPDTSDLRYWLEMLYNQPLPIRRAMMNLASEIQYSLDA